ncbi:MAG: phosphate acyltransferase [bacterium]|nr:phosphate acyltransferase [bacterium]
MLNNFSEVIGKCKKLETKKLALCSAEDPEALSAVLRAMELDIIIPILIGNKELIEKTASDLSLDISGLEIVSAASPEESVDIGVQLIRSGKAQMIMKGLVKTPVFMSTVLSKEKGLRTDRLISHCYVFESPLHNSLKIITDGGICPQPDTEQKKGIIRNALCVTDVLEIPEPKVALVCASETKNPKIPATAHAMELVDAYNSGEFSDYPVTIDGPFGIDVAFSKESAEHKKIQSPVAGTADIWLMPNLEAGNMTAKVLTAFANVKNGGILVGTIAPIILVSRSDTAEIKLNAIALARLLFEAKYK